MKKKIVFMVLLMAIGLAADEIIQPIVTNSVYMQQMAINNEGITLVRTYDTIRGLISFLKDILPFLYILLAIKLFYKDIIKFLKEKFK